ncbi:hypothetical protein IFM89_025894 [Coptis chinensis]|uniref:ENT domain-containing protein n=1 Tax=Coptis chinensis TaxID=261450 RepID=A0A835M0S9_9MAGN|nr:hypothetical protein IFM89_025894 [Coptis chinensis]
MKFKKGNEVEVLKREQQFESWFPGIIVSADRYTCTVRYDLVLNSEGNPIVEDVCKEDVRPYPQPVNGREEWVVGDTTEAFDLHCWRVGKVVKVLNNNNFVIRLSGSIQLKGFQKANLRVRHAWQNNKWVVTEKVGEQLLPEHEHHEDAGTRKNSGREKITTYYPVSTSKREHKCNFKSSARDAVMGGSVKRRKSLIEAEQYDMWSIGSPTLLKQVGVVSSPKWKFGKQCMSRSKMDVETKETNNLHTYFLPVCPTKESDESSVASCSSNGPVYYISQNFRNLRDDSGSSFNEAESLCASESGRRCSPSYDEVELEADVHKLELHAYRLTMQALYASGPLSWEQESLLTNLRLSLHISNEEHLFQLRQLLSSQVH